MVREREPEGSVRDCDALEALTDQLKSGEFSEAIAVAQRASEQQQELRELCVRPSGLVARGDPHTAFVQPVALDEEAELLRLRRERRAQLQRESAWKGQGHGFLKELKDEKEFVESIAPHESAVVLLDDGNAACQVCRKWLARWAPQHLEAHFCFLKAENAFFLTQMIHLEALPTLFVLSYGEVTKHLPPSQLFCHASASSPLFPKHFQSLLHRSGVIQQPEEIDSEDSD